MSLTSPALAGGFFTTDATWDVQLTVIKIVFLDLSAQCGAYVHCYPGGKDKSRDAGPPVPIRSFVSLCAARKEKMPTKL